MDLFSQQPKPETEPTEPAVAHLVPTDSSLQDPPKRKNHKIFLGRFLYPHSPESHFLHTLNRISRFGFYGFSAPAGVTAQAWQLLAIFMSTITGLVLRYAKVKSI